MPREKDTLCPLGFHPQVRWPTRCKRCFREYKDHAQKKEEESDYRSRSRPSSTSRFSNNNETSDGHEKDFSTPYSSISAEAQIRLNRLRDTSQERKAAATTDSLLSTPDSKTPIRRRTTDLSHVLESTNGGGQESTRKNSTSSSSGSGYGTTTASINIPHSTNKTSSSSTSSSSSSASTSPSDSNQTAPMPTPPGRRKFTSSPTNNNSSSNNINNSYSNTNETVTVRLTKSNSFTPSDNNNVINSYNKSRENSVSPSPIRPMRAKTPSIEITDESTDDNIVSSHSLTLPSAKFTTTTSSSNNQSSGDSNDVGTSSSGVKIKKPKKKRLLIQGVQEVPQSSPDESDENGDPGANASADVAFIIQVKSTRKKQKKDDDEETMSMTTTTDTTETTLVDANEYNNSKDSSGVSLWEYEELKTETERLKEKCTVLEKEKAEFLTRRVASLDAPKAQSTEYLKLQQKVNQLVNTNEDLKDEQKVLETKVRELENELASRPNIELTQRTIAELRSRLSSAEGQIDQLHEEKREAVQQMKDMQEEFEELQDGFREEQSEEFATLKKELDEASKNCRLLQFKLRKTEKRADQLEAEKNELEGRVESSKTTVKIAKLEEELSKAKNDYDKLLKETKSNKHLSSPNLSPGIIKKKSPVLTKAPSGEAVEPPTPSDIDSSQLLRDLQTTLERESDLREQLKFAEEEVQSLRQKINRIEDENESLLIQIKKMSSKSRPDLSNAGGKGNNGSQQNGEKVDVNELKLQLEINDQESKILRRKVEELENSNNKLQKDLQTAEEKFKVLESGPNVTKSKSVDEVSLLRRKIIEKEREVERLQTELLAVASKNKMGKMGRAKSAEVEENTKKHEIELKKLQNELAKVKGDSEGQRQLLEQELNRTKVDVENHQEKVIKLAEMNKNLVVQMEKFKQEMVAMKDHYESVQDDFVIKNSQLASAKEDTENTLKKLKKEHDTIDKELKALRETFNNRQDTWMKEKLALQDKMKEYEKMKSIPGDSMRFKHLMKDHSSEMDVRSHELDSYKDQILFMQKENDELRKKLEDFEKVTQVQMRSYSLSNEPSNKIDHELKLLREKLLATEKAHRNEIAQMKLRFDQQVALKNEEVSTVQAQFSRAKRERDTFRQMVDSAQRAISELKSRDRRDSVTGMEEAATGARAAVVSLQERVSALEDELTESRRDTSRAHTELVTEKGNWEMKMAELQQKINEMEEERLLSGRTRAAGQRTRLELAWQKEREEQQRRLKEATTLARDLKNTLLEFERERDRDRAESKRRIDQLKSAMEEDQEELRRKVGESQCDLLELRDAHAKLRTANEKLRRDRERLEKERDTQLKKELEIRRIHGEREKMVDDLIHQLSTGPGSTSNIANSNEVLRYLSTIKGIKDPEEITNPKERKRSNFRRAASAETDRADERQSQESLLSSVSSAYGKEHYGGRQVKYSAGGGSGSTNSSSTLTLPSRGRVGTSSAAGSSRNINDVSQSPYNPKGSLYRKSLSLEQTLQMPDEQKIWKGEGDAGSASSIQSMEGQYSRGSSVDSRLSTISTRSEKPKSSSLVGKMKKLVKSKSIEESPTVAKVVVSAGVKVSGVASSVGSDVSLNYESDQEQGRGRKLKDKVKGMFRRSSRSPSSERNKQTSVPVPPPRSSRENTPKKDTAPASTQRPLMPTESQQRPLMPKR